MSCTAFRRTPSWTASRTSSRAGRVAWIAALVVGLSGLAGCSGESDSQASTRSGPAESGQGASATRAPETSGAASGKASGPPAETRSEQELIAAGRSAYNANCIACHAMDPTQDGALGPAVAGSSYELLERRIVHGDYPEGYEPKRPSRVMVALPHLESRLPELAAYLGSLESS